VLLQGYTIEIPDPVFIETFKKVWTIFLYYGLGYGYTKIKKAESVMFSSTYRGETPKYLEFSGIESFMDKTLTVLNTNEF